MSFNSRPRPELAHWLRSLLGCCLLGLSLAAQAAPSILFVGNSFTYAAGSSVRFFHPDSVTDLNQQGIGGVPALFKAMSAERGLDYDVYLETQGGVGLDWHLAHKLPALKSKPWDLVVMHGYSTLDADHPGDPAKLVKSSTQIADLFHQANAKVQIHLMATWSRADQTYTASGHWYGQAIEAMGRDVRAGYDLAAAASPYIQDVIPVGEAFNRAIQVGFADPNPYDGIDAGKVDLWTYDHYHASSFGYYLEALVVLGVVTGQDPKALGGSDRVALELGFSVPQALAMQQIAHDQLVASGVTLRSQ